MFIGVNNVARKIKNCYVGVNGTARKVKAVYVGVNGVARLVWQSIIKKVTSFSGQTSVGSVDNGYSVTEVQHMYKIDDNHIIFGTYSAYSGSLRRCFLYNCYLDNNGAVTSFTSFETNYESSSSFQTNIFGISKFNDSIGVCVYQTTGPSSIRKMCLFSLASSNSKLYETQMAPTTDEVLSIIPLGNDTIMIATRSDSGGLHGTFYRCENNTSVWKSMEYLSPYVSGRVTYGTPIVFLLSNNRLGVVSQMKYEYYDDGYTLVVSIYNYSFDASNNITISQVSNTIIPYANVYKSISLDNDHVVLLGTTAIGLYINSNNTITYTNYLGFSAGACTRIGTSNSICSSSGGSLSILYYDFDNNTISQTGSGTSSTYSIYSVPYKNDSVLQGRGASIVYLDKLTFS